jgi:hypothetical protein
VSLMSAVVLAVLLTVILSIFGWNSYQDYKPGKSRWQKTSRAFLLIAVDVTLSFTVLLWAIALMDSAYGKNLWQSPPVRTWFVLLCASALCLVTSVLAWFHGKWSYEDKFTDAVNNWREELTTKPTDLEPESWSDFRPETLERRLGRTARRSQPDRRR